jgi:HK97 family phage prohead protease
MKLQETRYLAEPIEIRTKEETGETYITGYAARYNVRSKLIADRNTNTVFYEEIRQGAFKDVLQDADLNVVALFNHEKNQVLGRSTSGTLTLSEDEKGLRYDLLIPNTTLGNDLKELIKRGDISENSFAFSVRKNDIAFSKVEDGTALRSISKFAGLYDISLVTTPAYPETSVALRQLEEFTQEDKEKDEREFLILSEKRKREIDIYTIK